MRPARPGQEAPCVTCWCFERQKQLRKKSADDAGGGWYIASAGRSLAWRACGRGRVSVLVQWHGVGGLGEMTLGLLS